MFDRHVVYVDESRLGEPRINLLELRPKQLTELSSGLPWVRDHRDTADGDETTNIVGAACELAFEPLHDRAADVWVYVPVVDKPTDNVGHNEVWKHLALVVDQVLIQDGRQLTMGIDERTNCRDSRSAD